MCFGFSKVHAIDSTFDGISITRGNIQSIAVTAFHGFFFFIDSNLHYEVILAEFSLSFFFIIKKQLYLSFFLSYLILFILQQKYRAV